MTTPQRWDFHTLKRIHAGLYKGDLVGMPFFLVRRNGAWYYCLPGSNGEPLLAAWDRRFATILQAREWLDEHGARLVSAFGDE